MEKSKLGRKVSSFKKIKIANMFRIFEDYRERHLIEGLTKSKIIADNWFKFTAA